MGIFKRRKAEADATSTSSPAAEAASTNVALEQLAELFVSEEIVCELPRGDTPPGDLLDYSVESLALVDGYLESIRTTPMSDVERFKVCLRSGAYVGQVIRRLRPEVVWLNAEELQAVSSDAAALGEPVSTYSPTIGIWFPVAKVRKYLANGPEDSTVFFARVILGQSR